MDRIFLYPEKILRSRIPDCKLSVAEIKKIANRLMRIMDHEKHGIGIAAPQIGIAERIAIVDVSSRDTKAKRMVLVNPIILQGEDSEIGREGCMSVPDYTALIKRYQKIRFRYFDEHGQCQEKNSEGIEAVCVQHEIDHLNGRILIDAVNCLKTDLLPRHLK